MIKQTISSMYRGLQEAAGNRDAVSAYDKKMHEAYAASHPSQSTASTSSYKSVNTGGAGTSGCHEGPRCAAAIADGQSALQRWTNQQLSGIAMPAVGMYCAFTLEARVATKCADEMRTTGQEQCVANYQQVADSASQRAETSKQAFYAVTSNHEPSCNQ